MVYLLADERVPRLPANDLHVAVRLKPEVGRPHQPSRLRVRRQDDIRGTLLQRPLDRLYLGLVLGVLVLRAGHLPRRAFGLSDWLCLWRLGGGRLSRRRDGSLGGTERLLG